MPVTLTYPGVYIEEIPSGVRTITGVATSIAAFVDFFKRGPMNRAVQIFSFADFEREFGGLDMRSEASYAIQQFFLNGGMEAWVVRVAAGTPLKASVLLQSAVAGPTALTASAASEGVWGNSLRLMVDYATTQPASRFNLTVLEVATVQGRLAVVRQETFRNLSMSSADPAHARAVVNDGSRLVTVETSGASLPLASGTRSDEFTAALSLATSVTPRRVSVTFEIGGAAEPAREADLGTAAIASLDDAAARLEAAIRAANPGNPAWSGTTVRVAANRLQVVAGLAAPGAIITFGPAAPDTNTVTDLKLTGAGVTANVAAYQVGATSAVGAQGAGTAGADGDPPDAAALNGSQAVDPPTGLYALDKAPLFNLLCLPRIARVSGTTYDFNENQVDQVVSTATAYCEKRRAFLLLDAPSNKGNLAQIKDWLSQKANWRHRNVALYFPRIELADPLDNYRLRSFGASGTIAGICARTDAARGVWKAPAGTDAVLRNVSRLAYVMTDPENGALNPLGINCLRVFPVYGQVAWGARTLEGSDQQASEWKYLPVRRLALFLEESLYRGTQWVVFEPNDEPLWSQIRLNVGAFMHELFRQGAFQGVTPREAYFVRCDKETTTQNDINLGIVNILVGFAPLKPAEFVVIKISQIAGQVQT
jgi:phage tail sheath protein FI